MNTLGTRPPIAVDNALLTAPGKTITCLVWAYAALSALALVIAQAAHGRQADATRSHGALLRPRVTTSRV